MNYFEIGQRIRKYRKEKGYSQEAFAEAVGVSVTHMSHIETGNTKLSLPVLVKAAEVLEVRTDDLLATRPSCKENTVEELEALVADCTRNDAKIILEIARSAKQALKKYN